MVTLLFFLEPAHRLAKPESRLQNWTQVRTLGEQEREAAERHRYNQG